MEFIAYYVLVFIFGLLIGSFLNVCICRLPNNESVAFPPSHCTSCGTSLKPLDLIPVFSYLFLKGRCRYCGAKISIRYPAIELLTAVVFTVVFARYSFSLEFITGIFLLAILIAVFFIDAKHYIIPDELVITGLIGSALLVVYRIFINDNIFANKSWLDHLLGIFSGSGPLLLAAIIGIIIFKTDDAMGMGDVKIFAPIGIILGWKLGLVDLFLSVIIAGIAGLFLIITGIKKRKDAIPFGPFIVIATFITLMFGTDILGWYLNI